MYIYIHIYIYVLYIYINICYTYSILPITCDASLGRNLWGCGIACAWVAFSCMHLWWARYWPIRTGSHSDSRFLSHQLGQAVWRRSAVMLCRESRLGAGSNPILWQLFDALSRRFAPRQGRKFWPTLKGRFQLSLTLWLFCLVMFFSLFVSIFHFWCLGTGDSCTPRMWNCIALCSDTASARPRGCFRSCAEWRGGFDLCSTRAAGEVMKTPFGMVKMESLWMFIHVDSCSFLERFKEFVQITV